MPPNNSEFENLSQRVTRAVGAGLTPTPPSIDDISLSDRPTHVGPLKPTEVLPPSENGRYRDPHEIGRGGMGVVWKVYDSKLERWVAIKRVLPNLENYAEVANRFLTEARALAKLSHPNIVGIFDQGQDEGGRYIVMEYVEGANLLELLQQQTGLSVVDAIQLVLKVCDGLIKAHEVGIVHRDIKPSNILVDKDGRARLTDFGLARVGEGGGHSRSGYVLGTEGYMAPEQACDPRNATVLSDQYSLAATLYHLFTRRSPRTIVMKFVPEAFRDFLTTALEESPTERFPSVQTFRAELEQLRAHLVGSTAERKSAANEAYERADEANLAQKYAAVKKQAIDNNTVAQRFYEEYDDPQAWDTLQSIPKDLRDTKLEQSVSERLERGQKLKTEIEQRIETGQNVGLRALVEQYLKLYPEHTEMLALRGQLPRPQPGSVKPLESKPSKSRPVETKPQANNTAKEAQKPNSKPGWFGPLFGQTLSATEYVKRGQSKFELKDYTGAIADYDEAIRREPKLAGAYNNRGLAKHELKDFVGAMTDFNEAIRLDPKFALAYCNRGNVKDDLKDHVGAVADHDEAIRLDPSFAAAYNNRGNVKRHLKDYAGAIHNFNEAIRLEPINACTYRNRGLAKNDLKDHLGAIADFSHAIRLDPSFAAAYVNRGNAKQALKDQTGALADYDEAIRLDPNFAFAYNNRGIAKRDLKNLAGALADYNEAIRLDPNDVSSYNNRGNAKHDLKDHTGAIADYNEAIRLDSSFAFAFNNRGIAKQDFKDNMGAIIDYNEAIRLDPNYAFAYNNRGNARRDLKDLAGALPDYNEAIRLDPEYAWAYYGRGTINHDLKDHTGAIADYNEAIRLDSEFAWAYNGRGCVKRDLKDYTGAIADYNEAIRLDPNHVDAYSNRGYAKGNLKDHAGAIADYNEAIRRDPKNAPAYISRGWSCLCRGEWLAATSDFEKAIRLDSSLEMSIINLSFLHSTCPDTSFRDAQQAISLARQARALNPNCAFAMNTIACALALTGDYQAAIQWQQEALKDERYREDEGLDGGKYAAPRIEQWKLKELWLLPMS